MYQKFEFSSALPAMKGKAYRKCRFLVHFMSSLFYIE